jgi:hypothetical protein
MKTALFLAGDSYHKAEDAFAGAGPLLEEAGLAVDYITDTTRLNAGSLAGKALLVIHRDGMEFPNGRDAPSVRWMTPAQESAIENYVLDGGSFLALHNAGWDYPWQAGYRRTLGGYYLSHPPEALFEVHVATRHHPITQGVGDFEIVDEQHWLWFDNNRVTLLLTNHGQDGKQSAAGWAYDYGRGRVAFLANGHTLAAHLHPEFMKLKRNAIAWLIRNV